ncbi:PAS domain-containing sensor histidine kinase [Bacteroidota bacterium]
MVFKYFRINIVLRVLAILFLGFSVLYLLTETTHWALSIWIFIIIVILTVELIRYIEKSKKELFNFLVSIKQEDFTSHYSAENRPNLKYDLRFAYNEILELFKKLREEKEAQHQYLHTIVEHMKIALICFDEQNNITLTNKAAKELFNRPTLLNINVLSNIDKKLADSVINLKSNENTLVKTIVENELLNLSIKATEFKLQNQKYKLVSLQNIKTELEEQELESWQKLIRVITHEIMNSVLPISNLAAITLEAIENEEDEKNVLIKNLNIINIRSKGLFKFIGATKNFTQVPKPKFTDVKIDQLFDRIISLLNPKLEEKQITLKTCIENKDTIIKADFELIEQVIINLVLNSIEALTEIKNPLIELNCFEDNKNVLIQVKDNGKGISQEIIDKIFIPFYTTKEYGSGIGLSLSKQIMRMHKGNLNVSSSPNTETTFTLVF